ncbi:hypothetical protein [Cupriavidus sp. 8B]
MSADLRGFHYPLEPIRRQRQWQLDSLLAKLGAMQREVAQTQSKLDALQRRYQEQAEAALQAAVQSLNAQAHRRGLQWLMILRDQITEQEQLLAARVVQRDSVRRACLGQRQKVDVMERHRLDSMEEYVRAESGRLASEADREWIARLGRSGSGDNI